MKKIKALALLALLAVSPLILAAGSGGFPSRPKFHQVQIINPDSTVPNVYFTVGPSPTATGHVHADILGGDGNASLHIAGPSSADIYYSRSGTYPTGVSNTYKRWVMGNDSSLESGGNVGSDFYLTAFQDGGIVALHTNVFKCTRSTGLCSFSKGLSSLKVTGTASSTKACNFGTRITQNYCGRIGTPSALTTAGTCVDVGGAVTSGTGRLYELDAQINSANSTAARSISIAFYTDSGCTANVGGQRFFTAYEFAAVADGTLIARIPETVRTSRDHRYAKIVANSGGTGTNIIVTSEGYFD